MVDNYESNEIDWKVGDIVIHRADAKTAEMLMLVVEKKQTQQGTIYQTEYINSKLRATEKAENKGFVTSWKTLKKSLLDPAKFGIDVKGVL